MPLVSHLAPQSTRSLAAPTPPTASPDFPRFDASLHHPTDAGIPPADRVQVPTARPARPGRGMEACGGGSMKKLEARAWVTVGGVCFCSAGR